MDDFSGLEYNPVPATHNDTIHKTNSLLSHFRCPYEVSNVCDITASMFVFMYEYLFTDRLPGVVRPPITVDDDINNCQMVIDVLSADVIKDDLSHIRGVDIVNSDIQSIDNMIDIFTFLYECAIRQKECDPLLDTDDDICVEKPSPTLTTRARDVIPSSQDQVLALNDIPGCDDELLLEFLDLPNTTAIKEVAVNHDAGEAKIGLEMEREPQRDMIWKMRDAIGCSVGKLDMGLMRDGALGHDGYNDFGHAFGAADGQQNISKGQSHAMPGHEPTSAGISRQFDFIGVRPIPTTAIPVLKPDTQVPSSTPAAVPITTTAEDDLSATVPVFGHSPRSHSGKLWSTVGAELFDWSHAEPFHHSMESTSAGLSSFVDIDNLVQRTAAMTRSALDNSPLHPRHGHRSARETSHLLDQGRQPTSEALNLAQELNTVRSDSKADSIPSVKVHEVSSGVAENRGKSGYQDGRAIFSDRAVPDKLKDQSHAGHADPPSEGTHPTHRNRPRSAAVNSKTPVSTSHGRPASGHVISKGVQRLQDMDKDVLASVRRHVELGDDAYVHKQEILNNLYEEELRGAIEEVKSLTDKDKEILAEKEKEYRKLVLLSGEQMQKNRKAPAVKSKGYLQQRNRKLKPALHHKKVSTQKPIHLGSSGEQVLVDAEGEKDFMPMLLEEFPYLHLSEHTWHELWRKGIQQIENLTHAYEENKRRKNKAHVQLEDAAKRHELVASVVKEQIDHNRRMMEMREEKQQQVAMRNKVHERRVQSARARKYYDEYQVRARAKQLGRRTREEAVFRNLFKDGLAIQKNRIQDVRRYAIEEREIKAKKRKNALDSLENFYRDQFEMLVERFVRDRLETETQDKAHHKTMQQMKKDIRVKMEREIGDIQREMFRNDDDTFYRQLEADRLLDELYMAKCQARL